MPKGRGFLGCSQRTRHATPKGERRDRLTRALVAWLSPPLHRRRFPQALRYVDSLPHGEPARHSSPALKGGVFWRSKLTTCPTAPSRTGGKAGGTGARRSGNAAHKRGLRIGSEELPPIAKACMPPGASDHSSGEYVFAGEGLLPGVATSLWSERPASCARVVCADPDPSG